MQILVTTQKVTDGKLVITTAEGFEGKEVNVVITENIFDLNPDNCITIFFQTMPSFLQLAKSITLLS